MSTAAVTETTTTSTQDLRASALKAGTAAIQETTRLLQSLEKADQKTLNRVNNLLGASLAAVRGEFPAPEAVTTQPSAIELRRQEFVTKYNVEVLGDSKVSFTLPSGSSRLDLLNDSQAITPELLRQPAIYAARLAQWAKDPAFTEKVAEDTLRSVDGNVNNSARMTRSEQEAKGWNNVDLADLATAHQAYLIATGKDLFANKVVRARGGALYFYVHGLGVVDCYDDSRRSDVAASAALPARN
jgi:hypothetical protein